MSDTEKHALKAENFKKLLGLPLHLAKELFKSFENEPNYEEHFFPHGKCECRECDCCSDFPGPAAYWVLRGPKTLKVCTRCKCEEDEQLECLPNESSSPVPFMVWDSLGGLPLAADILVKAGKPLPSGAEDLVEKNK